ncbi:MAG: hypothetical protein RIR77_169 [Planctomycetota bacterium]
MVRAALAPLAVIIGTPRAGGCRWLGGHSPGSPESPKVAAAVYLSVRISFHTFPAHLFGVVGFLKRLRGPAAKGPHLFESSPPVWNTDP